MNWGETAYGKARENSRQEQFWESCLRFTRCKKAILRKKETDCFALRGVCLKKLWYCVSRACGAGFKVRGPLPSEGRELTLKTVKRVINLDFFPARSSGCSRILLSRESAFHVWNVFC